MWMSELSWVERWISKDKETLSFQDWQKSYCWKKSINHHCTSFLLRNYIMENRTSHGTDLLSMNISWSYEDLELLENNYDFTISLIFTVVRSITLILGIIVHRAFYKLMKRIPGRAINQIIYPYMVIYP